jgi:hypothetical protein
VAWTFSTYVASSHTNAGFYAATPNGFASGVDTGPLHALSDAAAGGKGVYRYTATGGFPSQTYAAGKDLVDVVFDQGLAADTTAPTISSTSPKAGGTGAATGGTVAAGFSELMDGAMISSAAVSLRNGTTQVSASVTYANGVAIPTPNTPLASSTTYTATVKGAFVANMHTDTAIHPGSQAIVASAQARGVPVVSASQWLTWVETPRRSGRSPGRTTS